MKRILLLCLFFVSLKARAGILLAPYFGYTFGEEETTNSRDYQGVIGGAKVGYNLGVVGLSAGGDLMFSSYDYDPGEGDFDSRKLGIFMQYNFPLAVQVSGTYFFADRTTFETTSQDSTYKGSGFKFGFGLTVIPYMTMSLEYAISWYDDVDGVALADGDEIKHKSLMFLISIPLDYSF